MKLKLKSPMGILALAAAGFGAWWGYKHYVIKKGDLVSVKLPAPVAGEAAFRVDDVQGDKVSAHFEPVSGGMIVPPDMMKVTVSKSQITRIIVPA